jgi:hypothetical protein
MLDLTRLRVFDAVARTEPVVVQRRVSATGVITVCWHKISLGRVHAGRTVTVHVSEHTLAIELDDETRAVRRTTTRPPRVLKGSRPYAAARQTPFQHSQRPADPDTEHPRQRRS